MESEEEGSEDPRWVGYVELGIRTAAAISALVAAATELLKAVS